MYLTNSYILGPMIKQLSCETSGVYVNHHFYNKKTQKLIDIKKSEISLKEMPNPPKGCKINKYDVIIEIE